MQVREIMTESPACCMPDSNLQEISKMMVDNDCGCIPVVENKSNMKPVGTVTDRDITVRTVAQGKNPLDLKASDIMTTDVVTIKPDSNVHECARVMKENDIRRVLVVDEKGGCCGIVAQADVAEYGPNPTLISNVVHDISESAPTPVNTNASGASSDTTDSDSKGSLLSFNSVLPLAVGVAAGAAFKYFTGSSEDKTKEHNVEKYRVSHLPDKTPMPLENYKINSTARNTSEFSDITDTTQRNENFSNRTSNFSDLENNTCATPDIGRSATQK